VAADSKIVDRAGQIERVLLAVDDFLQALDRRSWPAFESCFVRTATVYLAEAADAPGLLVPWQEIRHGWRQVFSAEHSRLGPLDPARRRPIIEVEGTTASVSFTGRPTPEDRAMVMRLVEGRWLIRRLNVANLPLRATTVPAKAAQPAPLALPAGVPDFKGWFVPVLVAALVLIALLGSLSDRRSATQLTAAVLAVFFGAVAVLRRDLGTWFSTGALGEAHRDVPLTGSGALVVAVGAAFLVT
jgi:hypothetical protein